MRSWDYKALQKVVFDSIPGHDFSRHADPVSSVHCKTDSDGGRKSLQDHRGVSFIPGPTSCSLVSSSGPPFYLLIKAPRYGRHVRRWFCCLSAFINGSLCHVCLSPFTIMNTWAYIGEVPTKACLVQSGRSSETAPISIVFIRVCLCFT